MAQQMSQQDYLVKYFPVFWKSLTGKVVLEKDCLAECLYHSDKACQYQSLWEDAGIHYFNGSMLYLLTHEQPWANECREVFPTPENSERHWFGPCDWVIANYERFREHLPHPIQPLTQTKLKTETQRGNCMVTAIAMVTGKSIEEIPPLETMGTNWHTPFFAWLKENDFEYRATNKPEGITIANGPTLRGTMHSVVCVDGKFFHDPHPTKAYLESISQHWTIKKKAKSVGYYDGCKPMSNEGAVEFILKKQG